MAKIKIKNEHLNSILKDLENLGKYPGAELGLKRVKLYKAINNELEDFEKILSNFDTETYKEYRQKRMDLLKDYGKKDKDGNLIPKKANGMFVGYELKPDKTEEFHQKVEDLEKEYEEVLKERDKREKEYEEIMQKETEFDIDPIPFELLKGEGMEGLKGKEWENLFIHGLIDTGEKKSTNKKKTKKKEEE